MRTDAIALNAGPDAAAEQVVDVMARPVLDVDDALREPRRDERAGRGRTRRNPWRKVLLYGLLLVLSVPFVFPTWWMVTSSLKPINEIFAFPPELWPSTRRSTGTSRRSRCSPSHASTSTRCTSPCW